MKILIVNTSDIQGGAARAAYRLHQGLLKAGIDSHMLVQSKKSDDSTVTGALSKISKGMSLLRPTLDSLPTQFYKNRTKILFSPAYLPFSGIVKKINAMQPDIVHLHWICGGLLRIEDLAQINAPIVWTLHDMWALTGGCHYDGHCGKYRSLCEKCPVLASNDKGDLSNRIFLRKKRVYSTIKNMCIVGLSKWMADCAVSSTLFKERNVVNLPNPLDCKQFAPIPKDLAKNILNLSQNKKHILFGALNAIGDPRKGFSELKQALQKIQLSDIEIIVFGSSKPEEAPEFKFPVTYLGQLHDDISLRLLYSAADVMVVPSLQENLSNSIMESLSCATPVVAFDIGGNGDMIEHKKNGYIAEQYDSSDLSKGMEWVFNDANRHGKLCESARQKVINNFDVDIVIPKYIELYRSILKNL
jgi:glycosyltransferase involved in cell wall biosynthesis